MISKLCLIALLFTASLSAASTAPLPPHPRLYLNLAVITRIQGQIKNDPHYIALWKTALLYANAFSTNPPKPQTTDYKPVPSSLEHIGDKMAFLAFVYTIGGDKKYFDACLQYVNSVLSYDPWGTTPPNGDMEAARLAAALSLVYDWLYSDLDPQLREKIKTTLLERENVNYLGAIGKPALHWWHSYLQGHYENNILGLGTTALALKGDPGVDNKQMDAWIAISLKDYTLTVSLLSHDGASQEGISYWADGTEHMLRFLDLAKNNLGVDLFHRPGDTPVPWFANDPLYRVYLSLPRNAWSKGPGGFVVDFADSATRTDLSGDLIMRKLAQEDKDPVAQEMVNEIVASNMIYWSGDFWLHFLWSDFSIPGKPLKELPTSHLFANMGIFSARSSWDGDESLLVFKCGAPMGHDAAAKNGDATRYLTYFQSTAHVHPDVGSFCLFGAGQWLIRNSGYAQTGKWTRYENTLRIDGMGQYGDGDIWFQDPDAAREDPTVTVVQTTDAVDYVVGDATSAYDPKLGLKSFQRHLIFLKKLNVVLVLDDIQANKPTTLSLDFHFENQPVAAHAANGVIDVWTAQDSAKKSTFRLAKLDPAALSKIGSTTFQAHFGVNVSIPCITLERHDVSSWQNAVALSWAAGSNPPPIVTSTHAPGSNIWTFTVQDEAKPDTVAVNLANHSIQIRP